MRVVIASDSFKGCLSSAEVNAALREGVLHAVPQAEVVTQTVSDGGEGWLDAMAAACGAQCIEARACDPLLRPITACYLQQDDLAIIEIAQVCGLSLLRPEERDPSVASTYGVGLLIADALHRGCRRFLVGLGGSATNDTGRGMLRALQEYLPEPSSLSACHFTICTDVTNPLCGSRGAATVFAPQKGATPAMVLQLEEQARTFARDSARRMGHDCSTLPGAGAAGGLGYAFMQFLHADCRPGTDVLLEAADFTSLLRGSALVITGEGAADEQTLMGKLPMGILHRTLPLHIPTILLSGRVSARDQLLRAGFADVRCIHPDGLSLPEAMDPATTRQHLIATAANISTWHL